MRITVVGLWHLGCVTAAVAADHFEVTGLDFDFERIEKLRRAEMPIEEPGLQQLTETALREKRLSFTSDPHKACAKASVLWVCYDTPVNERDEPDTEYVLNRIERCIPHLEPGTIVLVSSQLPVGTYQKLERRFAKRPVSFAYSPENLRLGNAIATFRNPGRIVVGVRDPDARKKTETLLGHFCRNILFMSPESAEMTKHALNGFLALSVTYMNEIAYLCERTGANAKDVETALKTDERIGQNAYLSPGPAFSGGTLARDVMTLCRTVGVKKGKLTLIPAIKTSNDRHRKWILEKILQDKKTSRSVVGILGLTYKPFTNTLRRSSAIELAGELIKKKFQVKVFDPAIKAHELPRTMISAEFCQSPEEVFERSDFLVLATAWPEFRDLAWKKLVKKMKKPCIIDPGSFVRDRVKDLPGLRYEAVGVSPS